MPGLEIVVSVLAGFAVPAIGWWRTSQDLRKERELDNEPFLIGWEVTRKIIIGNLALPHWPFKIAVNDKKIEDLHMFFVDVSNVGTQDISHPVELIISVRRHFIATPTIFGISTGRWEKTLFEERTVIVEDDKDDEKKDVRFSVKMPHLNRDERLRLNFWGSDVGPIDVACSAARTKLKELTRPEHRYKPLSV